MSDILGFHEPNLSTKICVLQICVDRLERDIHNLDSALANKTAQIDRCVARKPRATLKLQDEALAYNLVASLEAFIYEARSTYEMLLGFVFNFTRHVLKRENSWQQDAERVLKQAMKASGHSVKWVGVLQKERALFFTGPHLGFAWRL